MEGGLASLIELLQDLTLDLFSEGGDLFLDLLLNDLLDLFDLFLLLGLFGIRKLFFLFSRLFFNLSRLINQLEFIGIILKKDFSVAITCVEILLLNGDQFVIAFDSFKVNESLLFR